MERYIFIRKEFDDIKDKFDIEDIKIGKFTFRKIEAGTIIEVNDQVIVFELNEYGEAIFIELGLIRLIVNEKKKLNEELIKDLLFNNKLKQYFNGQVKIQKLEEELEYEKNINHNLFLQIKNML